MHCRIFLRLPALRAAAESQVFDRNVTATGCLSLSLPVSLRKLELDKSADLSLPVPHCPSLSVKENDYESEKVAGSSPAERVTRKWPVSRANADRLFLFNYTN